MDELHIQVKAEKKKYNSYVNQTASEIKMTSSQISDAEAQALAYEAQIKEQEANIEYLKKKLNIIFQSILKTTKISLLFLKRKKENLKNKKK